LSSTAPEFWIRYGIVLVLAFLVCSRMRTPLVAFTVLGVCVAGLIASFFENEQLATLVLVIGLTVGPFVGVIVDAISSRDRRVQSFIGRRIARKYVCPQCGYNFTSVQLSGQCPRCECRFASPK
jgi:hypothetical protein